MVEHIKPPAEENLALLKTSIEAGKLIGCTDSSVKNGVATASFAFQTDTRQIVVQGDVIVPGDTSIQCSHRGEMGGAAAALFYLNSIIDFMNITKGSITFGCDSDSVVNIGLTQLNTTNSITDHYDLVRICRKIRQQQLLPIKLLPTQVQGHTDKLSRRKTVMEKLNILCDKHATQMRLKIHKDNLPIPEVPNSYWHLSHEGDFS